MCKTYYVNPKIGDDENDGLHEDRAFATLFAINRLNLQPGDSVLLMRDCIFEKQFLQIRSSGTECCPITIGAYAVHITVWNKDTDCDNKEWWKSSSN